MSKKILSISFINESAEFIEVVRSPSGNFTLSSSFAYTHESLQAACSRADEIYVSSLFPSAQYDWDIFPKVQERYLPSLVSSAVQRKRPATKISARYQYIRDVIKDGNASSLIAYQFIEKNDIASVFELLNRFRQKVKYIYTLPTALTGAVMQSEKPTGNVLLLWVKEDVTVVAILSSDGLVKIARTLPYGLPGDEGPDAGHIAATNFSGDISREVIMTVSYFKQKFREVAPDTMYLLGDERLERIFTDFPLKNLDAALHFSLAGEIPAGIEPEKFNANVHLLGSIFANEAFNFLPVQEIRERRVSRILTAALVGLVLFIGLAGLWTAGIPAPFTHQDLDGRIRELQFDIEELQTSIARLKPIEGRKKYYQSAFIDRKPEFITLLQQVAAIMPAEMVFDSFAMTPAEGFWNCMITGKIRGKDWQERLDTLRTFGRGLYSFANIDIQNINHSLGQAGMDGTSISFQLGMQFIPGEEIQ